MPTYQYACTECGHAFDQVQSFTDESLTVCPQCQGRLRKVYNAVGVVFKGSGFYRNDSRNTTSSTTPASESKGESRSETKSETKSEKKSDSSGGSKGDSKPAAKSDSKPAASSSS